MDRLTVPEAATLLGVTQAAIYKRISRGKIPHDKEGGGHVYVYLDTSDITVDASTDKTSDRSGPVNSTDYIAELKAHNETLRQEVEAWRDEARRKDHIIAGLVQRVPELEAPSEASQNPARVHGEASSTPPSPEQQEPSQRQSWWRAFFGLE